MKVVLRCAFAALAMALGAQQALAQPVNGCPDGQAMQSSDPSGRQVTCIQVTEADIIGQWATTGTTTCLQASGGLDTFTLSPLMPTVGFTVVSQLSGDFLGTNTFYAGGSGRSVGASHVMTFPGTAYGMPPPGFRSPGGASVATLDSTFKWSVQNDGTLLIDHQDPVVQPLTAPPSLLGQTATIDKVPVLVGYISKDKRTIVITHPVMQLETSVRRIGVDGAIQSTSPRFCSRTRVLTRLP
ncbi:MAG TPA: hypothetical protein VGJ74_01290 [Burkholderiales bacterium]|jgi:hypothetical protein